MTTSRDTNIQEMTAGFTVDLGYIPTDLLVAFLFETDHTGTQLTTYATLHPEMCPDEELIQQVAEEVLEVSQQRGLNTIVLFQIGTNSRLTAVKRHIGAIAENYKVHVLGILNTLSIAAGQHMTGFWFDENISQIDLPQIAVEDTNYFRKEKAKNPDLELPQVQPRSRKHSD